MSEDDTFKLNSVSKSNLFEFNIFERFFLPKKI